VSFFFFSVHIKLTQNPMSMNLLVWRYFYFYFRRQRNRGSGESSTVLYWSVMLQQ